MSTTATYAPAPITMPRTNGQQARFSATAPTAPVPGWSRQPARTVAVQARMRLTRRGRLLVLALVLAAFGALLVTQAAPSEAGGAESAGQLTSVIVQPGDTLWQVAVTALPDVDPREAVQRVRDLNGLSAAAVRPGQRLVVPAAA